MKNRNNYESVIIIKGELTENDYKQALTKTIERIKRFADISNIDEKGKKMLAYEIRKNKMGYYVIFYYKAQSQDILEIERVFRITDEIIKFITVKIDN